MNDNKAIIDTDKVEDAAGDPPEFLAEDETKETQPKKKSKLKFHAIMMLVLGVGTWALITYAPIVEQWKLDWHELTHQTSIIANQQPSSQHTSSHVPMPEPSEQHSSLQDHQSLSKPETPVLDDTTPIFEDIVLPKTPYTNAAVVNTTPDASSIANLSHMISTLQEQLQTMQSHINHMITQQTNFNKQMVSAQMFSHLQQAASTQSSIVEAAAAWKSISLLPMLDADRRIQAEQAWAELQGLAQEHQAIHDEVLAHIQTLTKKLHPEALTEPPALTGAPDEPYSHAHTFQSWLDWFKAQYKLSKVDQHVIQLSRDPLSKIKTLIQQLRALQQSLLQGMHTTDIDTIVYQLEQYGITSSLSEQTIHHIQQIQQDWQTQAQAWMEQL